LGKIFALKGRKEKRYGKSEVTVTAEIDPKRFAAKVRRLVEKNRIEMKVFAQLINESGIVGTIIVWGPPSLQMALIFRDDLYADIRRLLVFDIERVLDALNQLGCNLTLKDLL